MDSEDLALGLTGLITDTVFESTDDLASALGKHPFEIFPEYIALLLWIAAKETQIVLPKEFLQPTIDFMFTVQFRILEESGAGKTVCFNDFNIDQWSDFIHSRFAIYYGAWRAFRQSGFVMQDQEANEELSTHTVAHNFVILCLTNGDQWDTNLDKASAQLRKTPDYEKNYAKHTGCVVEHHRRFSEKVKSVLSRVSSQLPALTQANSEDYFIESVASALKKDIDYLVGLGIKLEKGKLAATTGGAAWAGYEAFTGDWLSALVIGGISLLAGGLTNGYKRIKVQEIQQKWSRWLSELNQVQLRCLMTTLQDRYPLLLCQFQNLLQAGQG